MITAQKRFKLIEDEKMEFAKIAGLWSACTTSDHVSHMLHISFPLVKMKLKNWLVMAQLKVFLKVKSFLLLRLCSLQLQLSTGSTRETHS